LLPLGVFTRLQHAQGGRLGQVSMGRFRSSADDLSVRFHAMQRPGIEGVGMRFNP
jgi:hypothetical protein